MYNFVTTSIINQEFKKSKYFKKKLGMSITSKKESIVKFEINPKDKFVKTYYDKYGVILQSEGSIGKIEFYTDFYISKSVIGIYSEEFELIFDFEKNHIDQGIDPYIGYLLKEFDIKYNDSKSTDEHPEHMEEDIGNADKLFKSPGSVNYNDIKKYLQKRNNIKR